MASEYQTTADIINQSRVAAVEMNKRRGLDAAGLTAEFDERRLALRASIEKDVPDPVRRQRIIDRLSETEAKERETLRAYEFSEVYRGATERAKRNADDMLFSHAESWNLSLAQARNDRDNADRSSKEAAAAADDAYAKGVGGVADNMHNGFGEMYKRYYDDLLGLGASEDDARMKAGAFIGKKAKETMAAFIANGDIDLGAELVRRYEDLTATAKRDADGNIVRDRDGKAMTDPRGRLWMSLDDVGELKGALAVAQRHELEKRKGQDAKEKTERLNELSRISREIDRMLTPWMDPETSALRYSALNEKDYHDAVVELLNRRDSAATDDERRLAQSYIDDARRAYAAMANAEHKEYTDRQKKAAADDANAQSVRTRRDLLGTLEKYGDDGTINLVLTGAGGAQRKVAFDALQGKAYVLRKALMKDGVLKTDAEREQARSMLRRFEDKLAAARGGKIREFFANNVQVDYEGSWEVAHKVNDTAAFKALKERWGEYDPWGPTSLLYIQPEFTEGEGGMPKLSNAKSIVFRYSVNGQTFSIDGETMGRAIEAMWPRVSGALTADATTVKATMDELFMEAAKMKTAGEGAAFGARLMNAINAYQLRGGDRPGWNLTMEQAMGLELKDYEFAK